MNNVLNFIEKNENENDVIDANYFFAKLVIHFEELNLKLFELYKLNFISKFYEIKKLSEEYKIKLNNILSEIPKSLEKEMRNKLKIIYEKYKIKEKTKQKTEARIYSKYTEVLKLDKNEIGLNEELKAESHFVKISIEDYLRRASDNTKKENEKLRKEIEILKYENKYNLI